MGSSGLSAAALLMNVTSGERSKIAQRITSNEFSHELSQLQQIQSAIPGVIPELQSPQRAAEQAPMAAGPGLVVVPQPAIESSDAKAAPVGEASSVQCGHGKCGGTQTRVSQVKSKALSQQQVLDTLYFTDVTALERVLAQLRMPAEVRQTLQGTGDKQSRIPLKTVRGLLLTHSPEPGPNGASLVAAKDVQELVKSLCRLQDGAAVPLDPLKTKVDGSYSLAELGDLLSRIVRDASDKELRSLPLRERQGNTLPVTDRAAGIPELEPTVLPKGQVERLTRQRIPTFLRTSTKDWEEAGERVTQNSEMQARGGSVSMTPFGFVPPSGIISAGARQSHVPEDGSNPSVTGLPPSSSADLPEEISREVKITPAPVNEEVWSARPEVARVDGLVGVEARQRPQPFETGPNGGGDPFASDAWGSGSHAVSRPEAPVIALRAVQVDGQARENELHVERPDGADVREPLSSLEGRGAISLARGGQLTSSNEGGESGGGLDPSRTDQETPRQVADSTEAGSSGFETLHLEGERLTQATRSSSIGGADSGAKLRLVESTWPESLSRQIEESHRQGRSHLTIELEPEALGKLVLRVESDRNHVTAWVSTQSEEARKVLLHGASALRRHLEEQGLTLGQFNVDVGRQGGEQRFAQAGPSRKTTGRTSGIRVDSSVDGVAPRRMDAYASPDRLINVLA